MKKNINKKTVSKVNGDISEADIKKQFPGIIIENGIVKSYRAKCGMPHVIDPEKS